MQVQANYKIRSQMQSEFAGLAMQSLIAQTELPLTAPEMAEIAKQAWKMAEEMMAAAPEHQWS